MPDVLSLIGLREIRERCENGTAGPATGEVLLDHIAALEARHAGELAAIRAELEKLPHEAGCAFMGVWCAPCKVSHPFGSTRCCHCAGILPAKRGKCNCARGSAMKLAGGQDA